MKIWLIGENSKIGKSLIKHLPKTYSLVSEADQPDYIFLATSSEKARALFTKYHEQFKIVDFSGAYKSESLTTDGIFSYAFAPLFDQNKTHIVFPGCSSLAILTALYPLKEWIKPDSIFADVKFSKSAVQYKSDRQKTILINQVETVNPFNHFHEKEINQVLSPLQVKIVPSVINVGQGLYINIFFNLQQEINVEKNLQDYYQNNPDVVFNQTVSDVLDTNKINYSVVQDQSRVCISVITDNLINGKIYKYLK